jgi:hypothetical protein
MRRGLFAKSRFRREIVLYAHRCLSLEFAPSDYPTSRYCGRLRVNNGHRARTPKMTRMTRSGHQLCIRRHTATGDSLIASSGHMKGSHSMEPTRRSFTSGTIAAGFAAASGVSITFPAKAQSLSPAEARQIAEDAYVYGYSLITTEVTRVQGSNVAKPAHHRQEVTLGVGSQFASLSVPGDSRNKLNSP